MSFKDQLKAKNQAKKEAENLAKASKGRVKRAKSDEYVPPTPLEDLSVKALDRLKIKRLMDQHILLSQAEGKLRKQKEDITKELKRLCMLYGLERFHIGGNQTAYYPSTRQRIDKGMLMSQGVSLVAIFKATITKESFGLRVSPLNLGQDPDNNQYESEDNYDD
jgi:hypothetical protein